MAEPHAIARALGHLFRDEALLREALSPPSAGLPANNQRLEFLGDALLHACTGLLIFLNHPDWGEGWMSKLRGHLVGVESLRSWAMDMGVVLLQGPRSPKRPTPEGAGKPLADALEALLAAVHEDVRVAGGDGFTTVLKIVERRFGETIRTATPDLWQAFDPKTTLQERAAALGLGAPRYELLAQSGPDHQPRFRVQVHVGEHSAEASELSLKRAQAKAAGGLLEKLVQVMTKA